MNQVSPAPDVVQVTTTSGTFYSWVDTPLTIALVFALAGAVFIGIYCLRRIRNRGKAGKV